MEEKKKDPKRQKAGRIARQRGYAFEHELATTLSRIPHVRAVRLGAPSIHLPDIVAVSNHRSGAGIGAVLAIECKSGAGTHIDIPWIEYERCERFVDMFGTMVKLTMAIGVFRFTSQHRSRDARTYYRLIHHGNDVLGHRVSTIRCHYNGLTRLIGNNGLDLPSDPNITIMDVTINSLNEAYFHSTGRVDGQSYLWSTRDPDTAVHQPHEVYL